MNEKKTKSYLLQLNSKALVASDPSLMTTLSRNHPVPIKMGNNLSEIESKNTTKSTVDIKPCDN